MIRSMAVSYTHHTLKLYNWGEYMGEDLISNFEKEFGVKVIVELSLIHI